MPIKTTSAAQRAVPLLVGPLNGAFQSPTTYTIMNNSPRMVDVIAVNERGTNGLLAQYKAKEITAASVMFLLFFVYKYLKASSKEKKRVRRERDIADIHENNIQQRSQDVIDQIERRYRLWQEHSAHHASTPFELPERYTMLDRLFDVMYYEYDEPAAHNMTRDNFDYARRIIFSQRDNLLSGDKRINKALRKWPSTAGIDPDLLDPHFVFHYSGYPLPLSIQELLSSDHELQEETAYKPPRFKERLEKWLKYIPEDEWLFASDAALRRFWIVEEVDADPDFMSSFEAEMREQAYFFDRPAMEEDCRRFLGLPMLPEPITIRLVEKQYKRYSLKYHPDKSPFATAQEKVSLRKAFDELISCRDYFQYKHGLQRLNPNT